MELRSVDLNLLVAFDALMTERNVTRAGARIGLTQSAMSGALARLRDVFDDRLFERAPGGVAPTTCAEELIEPVRRGLAELQGALRTPRSFDAQTAQRDFRVAMDDFAALVLLPSALESVRATAPGVRLQLTRLSTHDAREAFADGAELALGLFKDVSPRFHRSTLFEEPYVVMMRAQHPLARGRLTLRRFANAEHLLVSPKGKRTGALDAPLARAGLQRTVAMVVPDWTIAALVIQSTDLILSGPVRIGSILSRVHGLKTRPLPSSAQRPSRIELVWPSRLHSDAGHRWLRGLWS